MEVFELKKPMAERQFSTASTGGSSFSRIGYVLTMAGIVLFTSAVLLVVHFSREYSQVSEAIQTMKHLKTAKLQDQSCEVPYCTTKECVYVAATMLDSLDPKVDPCSDFYRYSCGNYKRVKAVPYAMKSFSPTRESRMEMLIDIRKIMDSKPRAQEGTGMKKMRKFYESCYNARKVNVPDAVEMSDPANLTTAPTMQEDQHDQDPKNVPLTTFLASLELVDYDYVFGDPLTFEEPQRWTSLVSKLEEYRIHTLFKPNFVKLPDSPAPDKIEIDCKVPFLNPRAYTNTSGAKLTYQRVIYRYAMLETFKLFGLNWTASNELADEILKTEENIAKAVLEAGRSTPAASEESEDAVREQLTNLFYRTELLKSLWLPIVGEAIQEMELVFTCEHDLEAIVNAIEQTPNESLVKYIFWRLMMQLLPYLGNDFRGIHVDYLTKLPGTEYALVVTWKECADVLRTEFGLVAAKGLLEHGFIKRETLETVEDVFLDLKRHLSLILGGMEVFDNETRQVNQNKVKNMKLSFGYHNTSLSEEVLDRIYAELDFDEDYFSNVMKLKRFKARRHLTNLWYMNEEDPLMRTSLEEDPLGSSASYDYLHNTVSINLGLLRPPFTVFSENVPGYLNFGFSSLIAREMSRAFDPKGKHISEEGRMSADQRLAAKRKLEELRVCLSDQVTHLRRNLQDPNLLDARVLESLMFDFSAFVLPQVSMKSYLRRHASEKPLPGIHLNKKQTYYVQAAQMMCEVRDDTATENKGLLPDSRVNQVIMNLPDFGDVFDCPPKSAMNPINKCTFM